MPFKSIGREFQKLRKAKGSLRQIEDVTGVVAPRISEIENGRAYLGPYVGALAPALGDGVFPLAIREAELRGLRPAAEIAVEFVIARDAPVIVGVWNPDSLEGRAEYERQWREKILERDVATVLTMDAVLAEIDKHYAPRAMRAGFAGSTELHDDELDIIRDVIAEAIAEQAALRSKIRETAR